MNDHIFIFYVNLKTLLISNKRKPYSKKQQTYGVVEECKNSGYGSGWEQGMTGQNSQKASI
jgi:hypothetical protein